MTTYNFEGILETAQYLRNDTLTPVTIKFEYYFEESFDAWHVSNYGLIRLLEVKDSKCNFIDIDSISVQQQIAIRILCNNYLDENNLRPYLNVIPLYQYPIGIRQKGEYYLTALATILPFKPRKCVSRK